jgi:hypothetical protein
MTGTCWFGSLGEPGMRLLRYGVWLQVKFQLKLITSLRIANDQQGRTQLADRHILLLSVVVLLHPTKDGKQRLLKLTEQFEPYTREWCDGL